MKSIAAFLLASLFIVSFGVAARADQASDSQQANKLLNQARATILTLHVLTADITVTETRGGKTTQKTGTLKLLKPNYLMEELWTDSAHAPAAAHEILASNGQSYWQIASDGTLYKDAAAPDGSNIGNTDSISTPGGLPDIAGFATLFFDPAMITQIDPGATASVSSETSDGQTFQVVTQSMHTKDQTGTAVSISAKLYLGTDNLIHQVSLSISTMGSADLQLSNVKNDASLTKADFAFTPPSWAKPAPATK